MSRNINNITQTNGYTVLSPNIKKVWSDQFKMSTNSGSGDVGVIIPVYWREMIPGEKANIYHDISIQFTPFVTNLLHEFKGEIIDEFVPYRLCAFLRQVETIDGDTQEQADEIKWNDFITGGKTGEGTITPDKYNMYSVKNAFNIESEDENGWRETLLDYFYNPQWVIQTAGPNTTYFNAWKVNAYNLIYNEKLRNPDITPFKRMGMYTEEASAEGLREQFRCARAYWLNDRFTRARKYQIRGNMPELNVSTDDFETYVKWSTKAGTIGGNTDIYWTNRLTTSSSDRQPLGNVTIPNAIVSERETEGDREKLILGVPGAATTMSTTGSSPEKISISQTSGQGFAGQPLEITGRVEIDTMSGKMDYVDYLYNLAMLKYMANNARMKPRYTDFLKERYGIIPQDSRFNEPEHIQSMSFNIGVDIVTQTSGGTNQQTPSSDHQGNITSQAWGWGKSEKPNLFTAYEHGILISLMIIRPANVYEGGLEKIDRADRDRFSFPIPEFVNLPDEKILSSELFFTGRKADDTLFGWEQIYDYYRSETNRVCGWLRPSFENGLYTYTLARTFLNSPTINDDFLLCKPDMARIKQYTNQPDFLWFHRDTINEAIMLPLVNDPVNAN